MQNLCVDFRLVQPCSHCYLHPEVIDGPCKVYSQDTGFCVNQAESFYCSTSANEYTSPCASRATPNTSTALDTINGPPTEETTRIHRITDLVKTFHDDDANGTQNTNTEIGNVTAVPSYSIC